MKPSETSIKDKQAVREEFSRKLDLLLNNAPRYGSISITLVLYNGKVTRVTIDRQETELAS
jgi:hypothetical protein